MGKFNQSVATTTQTTNLAGGSAYDESPEFKLVSALLTSFLEDKFYQTGEQRTDAIKAATKGVDPLFAAKAAIYARNEFGMRSTSHVVAGEIANTVKGVEWTKNFFDKIVRRPDDMTEILAYYYANYSKNEPQALRKGFAKALARFDAYQLAKYRGESKSVKLVDVVNLVHPKPTEAIGKLVRDELRNTNTFEAKISAAGKSDSENAKKEAWSELVMSGKLGYLALIRNLRNIINDAPEVIDEVARQLTNPVAIKKSLVLPFQVMVAGDEVSKISGVEAKKVIVALSRALDMSTENIPKFEGRTLVAIDKSGSMSGDPIKKAALFGGMLAKSNYADVILWDTGTESFSVNPQDSLPTIAGSIVQHGRWGGGTDVTSIFRSITDKYDRIVILTDEQSWRHAYYNSPTTALAEYRHRTGANPTVYNWDLAGYGSLSFPETKVAALAGWSDKVFDIMKLIETDKKALVNTIKAIEL